jgi:hypothetical protein
MDMKRDFGVVRMRRAARPLALRELGTESEFA